MYLSGFRCSSATECSNMLTGQEEVSRKEDNWLSGYWIVNFVVNFYKSYSFYLLIITKLLWLDFLVFPKWPEQINGHFCWFSGPYSFGSWYHLQIQGYAFCLIITCFFLLSWSLKKLLLVAWKALNLKNFVHIFSFVKQCDWLMIPLFYS